MVPNAPIWSVLLTLHGHTDEAYARAYTPTDARLFVARRLAHITSEKDTTIWLRRIIGVREIPHPSPSLIREVPA